MGVGLGGKTLANFASSHIMGLFQTHKVQIMTIVVGLFHCTLCAFFKENFGSPQKTPARGDFGMGKGGEEGVGWHLTIMRRSPMAILQM